MATKPVIGVLLGDAAGVGPELVAKCAAAGFYDEYCRPVVIGDLRVLERALDVIGAKDKVALQVISDVDEADWSKGLPVLDQKNLDPAQVPFGTKTVESGKACLDMLVVVLVYSFVRIFLPTGIPRMPFYVFLFACFVEVLQYFQLVETLGITNRAARIILGSTFDWADIACYAVGCVFIVLFERIGKNS